MGLKNQLQLVFKTHFAFKLSLACLAVWQGRHFRILSCTILSIAKNRIFLCSRQCRLHDGLKAVASYGHVIVDLQFFLDVLERPSFFICPQVGLYYFRISFFSVSLFVRLCLMRTKGQWDNIMAFSTELRHTSLTWSSFICFLDCTQCRLMKYAGFIWPVHQLAVIRQVLAPCSCE